MPVLTIKNMPDNLYEQLKEAAKFHRRSLNGEIIHCIEQSIGVRKVDIAGIMETARKIRSKTARHILTDDELNAAKNEGRP
ncbi:MAG: Arc family DNA-binding protein [bacterium]|nr:Arc family DNA-binding protein [bacterium]